MADGRHALVLLAAALGCHDDTGKAPPAPEPSVDATQRPRTSATANTQDEPPSRSPDGKRAVFLRKLGDEPSKDGLGPVPDNRVMLVDLASRTTSEIARNNEVCASLWAPKFAFDDAVLVESYGFAEAAARSRAVCAIDLTTKKMSLLSRGTLCALPITAGRYRGSFLVPESSEGNVAVEKHWVVDKAGVLLRRFPNNPLAEVWSACDDLRDRARAEAIFKSM